jgi:hypothetical protein
LEEIGGLGAGGGAGVEPVDLVDEDQTYAGLVVGVADGVGDRACVIRPVTGMPR